VPGREALLPPGWHLPSPLHPGSLLPTPCPYLAIGLHRGFPEVFEAEPLAVINHGDGFYFLTQLQEKTARGHGSAPLQKEARPSSGSR
jgi:hypothetical protein